MMTTITDDDHEQTQVSLFLAVLDPSAYADFLQPAVLHPLALS